MMYSDQKSSSLNKAAVSLIVSDFSQTSVFSVRLCPGGRVAGLVYGYGEDDLNRTEDVEDKGSGNEDSRDSNSVSIRPLSSFLQAWFGSASLALSTPGVRTGPE